MIRPPLAVTPLEDRTTPASLSVALNLVFESPSIAITPGDPTSPPVSPPPPAGGGTVVITPPPPTSPPVATV